MAQLGLGGRRRRLPLAAGAVGIAVLSLATTTAAGTAKRHADLEVLRVTVTREAAAIIVAETTTNIGDAAAPASVTGIYLSGDRARSTADPRVARIAVRALRPGQQERASVSITASALRPLAGRFYVLATADDLDRVVERSERNNTAASFSPVDLSPAPPSPAQPPSAPGLLTASVAGSSEIDVAWGAASDNVAVTGYELDRCEGSGCSSFALLAQPAGNTTSYRDTGLPPGTSYGYRVRAVDGAGGLGPFSNIAFATTASPPATPKRDSTPPSAPTGLATSGIGRTSALLAWSAAADDVGVAGYRLYLNGAPIATSPTTSYAFQSLTCGTGYTLGVAAFDAAGNVSVIATIGQRTSDCPDTTPPTAPGGLAASATRSGEIDLTWSAASDNVAVTGYELFRCEGVGCSDFSSLAGPSATDTSFSDTGLTANTSYTYELRAVDAAANRGPFSPTATAVVRPGFISVGPTGRYLVDQSGAPFLIAGDSPQAMIGDLTVADAEYFFADRRAHGFNAVWINLLCTSYTACNADGTTWDGIAPFTTPGDFSTPNEAYFARADQIIRLASRYGLVVFLDPAETGGWLDTMRSNGVDKLRAYGRFLGARYEDFPNIVWMHGNDYQNWGPVNDPYVTAVAQGIEDIDSRHIETVELNYLTSGSLDDSTWAPLIGLNASYTYFPTYDQVLHDYDRSNFIPTFLVEGTYEFEQNASSIPFGNPKNLRSQEYWSILSGATGQLYGNHYTWQFACNRRDDAGNCVDGWKSELDTPGADQIGYLMSLFTPLDWYDLVPDQAHAVVTDGLGTYGTDDYVTAARTPDGTLAMAYVPTSRAVTVDLSTLSGPVTARWYDPAAGTFVQISGSPFANTGDHVFSTPGANADGDTDWVLVLQAH